MSSDDGNVCDMGAASSSSQPALSAAGEYRCIVTGDRLFSDAAPHTVFSDGLLYRVQGSTVKGINAFADDPLATLTATNELPLSVIDQVQWAGLKRLQLDKPAFVKHWCRYVESVSRALSVADDTLERVDHMTLQGHSFTRGLLERFDELDFLTTASADPRGALVVVCWEDGPDGPGLTPALYFLLEGCIAPREAPPAAASRREGAR